MNKELEKNYDPQKHEDSIYKKWEESGFFNPDVCIARGVCKKDAKAFSIVLPPPNVTGNLHVGHAVMLALQDVMVRYHRMQGEKTLWVPGTDHAAIATQSKVDRLLWEREKKTRHDLGREAFLKQVEQYAQASHDTIVNQARKMGASLDWSREVFTLDDERSLAVRTAFKKMYDEGLIYRGSRIVNWDPKMQTTVSDDEVERKEEQAPFYYLKYGPFIIGTARPETKFGDKYVVMHPDDERYADYEDGQKIDLEWINGPIMATVVKDEVVDMNFGTGVMTITPWHDATDFDIAERHNLDKDQIIDYDGKLLPIAGEFRGMHIKEARKKIVAKLEKKGLLEKVDETYRHNVAVNSRGGEIIEPQIKEQWFINVNAEFKMKRSELKGIKKSETVTLKKLMRQVVESGQIEIVPERFKKIYFHWIDNLRDWCISRQIWYGHQIPVWYCQKSKGKSQKKKVGCNRHIVSIEEVTVCPHCGGEVVQDSDTLDTWFSSGLWTFSPLGWPHFAETATRGKSGPENDLANFHPMSVMETGYDILFFWVARMVLMTTYLFGEIPFEKVYLHGLVRDEKGRKMSKSLDNIIDPLDVIAKYGTDAARLSLMIGSTPGNDVKLSEEKIASYRNFTNKLWNISRYVLVNTEDKKLPWWPIFKAYTSADSWILKHMVDLIIDVTDDLNNLRFAQAGEKLRDFTWNKFADWYVEVAKFEYNEVKDSILRQVLEGLLRLWHPFMPFVTEVIWREMGHDNLLMVASWPKESEYLGYSEGDSYQGRGRMSFDAIKDVISAVRNLRSEYKIAPKEKIKVLIYAGDQVHLISDQLELIKNLRTGIGELEISKAGKALPQAAYAVAGNSEIYIPLEGLVDLKQEVDRLAKRSTELKKVINNLDKKLDNKNFVRSVPKEIIQAEIEKLDSYKSEQKKIKEQLKHLK